MKGDLIRQRFACQGIQKRLTSSRLCVVVRDVDWHDGMQRSRMQMLLDMVMENGDIAVSANPFRMLEESGEIQSVDNSGGTITTSYTPNRVYSFIVQKVLKIAGTQCIVAGKLMVFDEKSFVIKNVKTDTFQPLFGRKNLLFGDFPGGRSQRDGVTNAQKRRNYHKRIWFSSSNCAVSVLNNCRCSRLL